MFEKKHKPSWGQVIGAIAALKLIPFKKTLLGIAAVAGTVYAVRRVRAATAGA